MSNRGINIGFVFQLHRDVERAVWWEGRELRAPRRERYEGCTEGFAEIDIDICIWCFLLLLLLLPPIFRIHTLLPLNLRIPFALLDDRELAHIQHEAFHYFGAAGGLAARVCREDDDGDAGDAAGEQFVPDGGNGIADPVADGWVAGLVDGGVVEARGHEAGARVEGPEVEERVDVGGQEVGEVGEGCEVGLRHGRRWAGGRAGGRACN